MDYPADMIGSDDLSTITGYVENYSTSSELQSYAVYYYHIPFFIWVICAVVFLFISRFIIIEFIIRWRRNKYK